MGVTGKIGALDPLPEADCDAPAAGMSTRVSALRRDPENDMEFIDPGRLSLTAASSDGSVRERASMRLTRGTFGLSGSFESPVSGVTKLNRSDRSLAGLLGVEGRTESNDFDGVIGDRLDGELFGRGVRGDVESKRYDLTGVRDKDVTIASPGSDAEISR